MSRSWLPLPLLCVACLLGAPTRAQDPDAVRFVAVDVIVATDHPLAAYQVAIEATTGRVSLVGLEGNAALPFQDPPYYDPRALQRDRVIVAGFSTAAGLPQGEVRVATLHLEVRGQDPAYRVRLEAAAGADGSALNARTELRTN